WSSATAGSPSSFKISSKRMSKSSNLSNILVPPILLSHNHPVMTCQVADRLQFFVSGFLHHPENRLSLIMPDLQQQPAAGTQIIPGCPDQPSVKIQSILTAVQRQRRIKPAHLIFQASDYGSRNIRGIRHNHIII